MAFILCLHKHRLSKRETNLDVYANEIIGI